jgi:hypothetical protein
MNDLDRGDGGLAGNATRHFPLHPMQLGNSAMTSTRWRREKKGRRLPGGQSGMETPHAGGTTAAWDGRRGFGQRQSAEVC